MSSDEANMDVDTNVNTATEDCNEKESDPAVPSNPAAKATATAPSTTSGNETADTPSKTETDPADDLDFPLLPKFGDDIEDSDDDSSNDTKKEESPVDVYDKLAKAVSHKEEGNAFFKSGNLDKAGRSYRRGTAALRNLNVNNTGDDQVKNLLLSLQTNLSMICLKQGKHKMSRDVATNALDIDKSNVKALYRRAAAHRKLGDVDKARNDLKEALKIEPNNRDVKRELISLKAELDAFKKKERDSFGKAFKNASIRGLYNDKEEATEKKKKKQAQKKKDDEAALQKRKTKWEDECVHRMSLDEPLPAISYEDWDTAEKKKEEEVETERKKKKKAQDDQRRLEKERLRKEAKRDSDNDNDDDDSDEEIMKELQKQNLRGYKKTSDGKTTSYFNHEQTAEGKALIGDITPKRLESGSGGDCNSTVRSSAAESAWNTAGTWEERDTTEWCTEALRKRLLSTKVTTSPGADGAASVGYTGSIKEVKDLSGDASFATASGKKKYIFDFHTELSFQISVPDADFGTNTNSSDETDVTVIGEGTLNIPDVCSTVVGDGNYDVEVSWKKRPPSDDSSALECANLLVNATRQSVNQFVVDFNECY